MLRCSFQLMKTVPKRVPCFYLSQKNFFKFPSPILSKRFRMYKSKSTNRNRTPPYLSSFHKKVILKVWGNGNRRCVINVRVANTVSPYTMVVLDLGNFFDKNSNISSDSMFNVLARPVECYCMMPFRSQFF